MTLSFVYMFIYAKLIYSSLKSVFYPVRIDFSPLFGIIFVQCVFNPINSSRLLKSANNGQQEKFVRSSSRSKMESVEGKASSRWNRIYVKIHIFLSNSICGCEFSFGCEMYRMHYEVHFYSFNQ